MKKHHQIGLLMLGCFSLATAPMEAYVYGYTRLYRSDTQTTIDLVYDRHTPADSLTHDAMHIDLCDDIKQGLHATEKVLVESLEHLNKTHPDDTTVIWEHAGFRFAPKEVHLLTYPERLVIRRLRNLNFVSSDTWRHEYPGCILSVLRGSSLIKRVNRDLIIENSGYEVWKNYQAYIRGAQERLVGSYGPYRELVSNSKHNDTLYKDLFFARHPYSEIADLEMLSHILASSNHRVVLFAGGAHSESIANFLISHTPCEIVYSVIDRHHHELDPHELERIAADYGERARGSQKSSRASGKKVEKPQRRIPLRSKPRVEKAKASRLTSEPTESIFSEDERKQLLLGGALVLSGILVSAYYEHKATRDHPITALVKQKLSTVLKYGSLPGALGYLYLKYSRAA